MKLILRADDIGYSEAVNYGIEKSIREGLITSAGIMPNMPYAKHGYDLVKNMHVCLGQHTNLCVGYPCADPKQIPSLLDDDGKFISSKKYRDAFKKGIDLINVDEAVIEVEAQYHRYCEIVGEKPKYFEAHALPSKNLMKALEIVAEKYELKLNRMTPMDEYGDFDGIKVRALSANIMGENYNPFHDLKLGILNHEAEPYPMVFVCHPGYIDSILLKTSSLTLNRTKEVEMLCNPLVKEWLDSHNVELISYENL